MPLVPVTGLEDERRDRVRPFELDDFLEHRQRLLGGVPAARDAVIRIEHVDDAGHARAPPAQRRGSPVSIMLPAVAP